MRHIFSPNPNNMSPLNCRDIPFNTKVRAGDEVLISTVFTWDKPVAESMGEYYKSIGANVQVGGPAYDDPGGEFEPNKFTAPGVTITHRGCVRNCPWCYVPKREGLCIRHLEIKEGNILQDNNFLACNAEHREKVYAMLKKQRAISLRGGLDARLLRDSDIEQLRGLRLFDLWTAYDSMDNQSSLSAVRRLRSAGIPQSKIRVYVLVGFGGESMDCAEDRLRMVWEAGAYPFAQLYDGHNGADILDWKRFARRWSRPAIYKSIISRPAHDKGKEKI